MKIFTLALLLFFGLCTETFSQAPTVAASSVNFTIIEGGSMRVNWTSGNGARRIVIMRAGSAVTAVPANGVDYNANIAFGSGDAVLPGQFVVFDGPGSGTSDVTGLQPATVYHVAVFEYNGTAASTQYLTASFASGSQSTVSAPATPASSLVFSNVTGNSMTLNWTNGSGARRLVVVRAGSPVNANPTDVTFYSANTVFGNGAQIGTGNYAVLSFNSSTVTVTGLQPSTVYHYAVYEYNGNSLPVYLVTSPATGSQSTLAAPTVASTGMSFSIVEGNSMRTNWTAGNGARRIVVMREGAAVTAVPVNGTDYAENLNFSLAAEISPGQRVVYDATGSNTTDITGLQPNTIYHVRVYEYDGTGAAISYLTSSFLSASQSTATTPTIQASAVVFSNVTGNSFTVGWTNGNGARRLVLVKAASAVDADPVNLNFYNANTNFGSGSQIGIGNYTVYSNTGNSVNVAGLSPGVTYHVAVFEYNGNSAPVYLGTPARNSQVTATSPTVASSSVNFTLVDGSSMRMNWTAGNGSRRIVVMRAGAAVTAVPSDGVDYAESLNFNTAAEISPGERVVYDNTGSNTSDITGLVPNTVYHVRIYEYNGTGATIDYLTSLFATASQSTSSAPSTQASNISFTNVSGSTLTVNWTNGNGAGRLVVARAGSPVDADPTNLTTYSNNTIFGSGAQIGTGNYSVYNGTANSVTITNLNPGITYHFAIYEYNGNSGRVYTVPGLTGSVSTSPQPTIPSSNMVFTLIEGSSMRTNWTAGNGARRILVMRAGSPVTAIPVNGTDYAENLNFNLAAEISPGQRVVYDATSSNTSDITGLVPNTVYHFRVYEYDGTGAGIAYLTGSFASGSQSTSTTPAVQASNMTFTSVGATSMTVNWTTGDGVRRILVARQGSPVNADPADLISYSGFNTFGTGTQIGTGNYAVSVNTGTNVTITGLISGTTYHFALYEANGNSAPVYLRPGITGAATTIGAPQTQAQNAAAGNISSTSMQINWTNGSGNRRLLLMKQGGAVDANPVDNTPYSANSFFGSGTQVGAGNYAVYDGTGSTVTVTNLQSNTTYHFAVFEYNSFSAASMFLVTNPATGSAATSVALPVLLVGFKAHHKDGSVQLEWSTASEENSSHFEIQKSRDGANYTTIGIVAAKGNSTEMVHYSFLDGSPYDGISFYCLRQVDKDGSYSYSPVARIVYESKGLVKKIVNPVTTSLFVQLTTTAVGEWRLYDLAGKLIKKENFRGDMIQTDLSALPKSSYVFEIITAWKKERIVLIKSNQ